MALPTRPANFDAYLDTASVQAEAYAFADQFPTPNVLAAIAHAEAGNVTWVQVRDLFARSLASGLATVRETPAEREHSA